MRTILPSSPFPSFPLPPSPPVRSKTFLTGCFQVRPAEPTELTFFPSPPFYPPNFYRFALHERQSFSLYSIDVCVYRREALLLCCTLRLIGLEAVKKINRVVIPWLTMTKPSPPCSGSKQLRSPCRIAFCSGYTFLRDDPSYLITLERTRRGTKETERDEGNVILLSVPLFLANSFRKLRDRGYPPPRERLRVALLSQFPDFPREFRVTFRTRNEYSSRRSRIPSEKSPFGPREAAFKLLASARGEGVALVKSA